MVSVNVFCTNPRLIFVVRRERPAFHPSPVRGVAESKRWKYAI